MTVKELIEFLQTQPQDMQVAYCCFSEQCLLEEDMISIIKGCKPRDDGWIQDARPDYPDSPNYQEYLLFPGN